ncbi:Hypothetical protein PBC10988_32210 [Planctomycetales bacterium 10988]|nr:Hypothetical protein PBC10988_32210 [Planctomycetales bacterium 10988]
MSSSPSTRSGSKGSDSQKINRRDRLEWRVWPIYDGDFYAWMLLFGMMILAAAATWLTGRLEIGLLTFCLLLLTTWQFFVPITYQAHFDGIQRRIFRRWLRLPWQRIRTYRVFPNGVFLSLQSSGQTAEALRGTFIPFGTRMSAIVKRRLCGFLETQLGEQK